MNDPKRVAVVLAPAGAFCPQNAAGHLYAHWHEENAVPLVAELVGAAPCVIGGQRPPLLDRGVSLGGRRRGS